MSKEFTPVANHLGQKKSESRQGNQFFLKPIGNAQFFAFPAIGNGVGIWPILVEVPLDEIELQNKEENIAFDDKKQIVSGFTGFAQLLPPKDHDFCQFEGNHLTNKDAMG